MNGNDGSINLKTEWLNKPGGRHYPFAYNNYADLLMKQGKIEEAHQNIQKAIILKNKDLLLINTLGEILIEKGLYAQAVALLEKVDPILFKEQPFFTEEDYDEALKRARELLAEQQQTRQQSPSPAK